MPKTRCCSSACDETSITASVTPCAQPFREKPVQLERFRSGVRSRKDFPRNVIFNRSDQRRLTPGGVQD